MHTYKNLLLFLIQPAKPRPAARHTPTEYSSQHVRARYFHARLDLTIKASVLWRHYILQPTSCVL